MVHVHLFQALLGHFSNNLIGDLFGASLFPHVLAENSHHLEHLRLVDKPTVVYVNGGEDFFDESFSLILVTTVCKLNEVFRVKFVHFY